jgi:hypothetical protein
MAGVAGRHPTPGKPCRPASILFTPSAIEMVRGPLRYSGGEW